MAIEHGYAGYTTHRCRCGVCTEANRLYERDRRSRARERQRVVTAAGRRYVAPISTHGVSGYQNHYCRCDVCVAAKSLARRSRSLT